MLLQDGCGVRISGEREFAHRQFEIARYNGEKRALHVEKHGYPTNAPAAAGSRRIIPGGKTP